MRKTSIIFSLIFAPLFLIYKSFYGLQTDSFVYLGSKLLPAFLASIFFVVFLLSLLYKKHMILHFTQQFYKKELLDKEIEFLKKSDLYWVLVTFFNTALQVLFALFSNDIIWAFYASIGWYLYFAVALLIQVIYGKIFILNERKSI